MLSEHCAIFVPNKNIKSKDAIESSSSKRPKQKKIHFNSFSQKQN